jgi:hypothetical protein
MTEAEWLACEDPTPLIGVVKDGATERQMRLLALSCCWRNEYLVITDDVKRRQMPSEVERRRRAIAVLESRIEGAVSERELREALGDASAAGYGSSRDPSDTVGHAVYAASVVFHFVLRGDWEAVVTTASEVPAYDALTRSGNPDLERIAAFWRVRQSGQGDDRWRSDMHAVEALPEYVSALRVEQSNQANLLRDIFGNPFPLVSFSPEWRTDTVVALAHQMYESREFSAMPILADALQDAGCDSADILDHCRGPGPHVRGCWVVDLVLARE